MIEMPLMKRRIDKPFLLTALIGGLGLLLAGRLTAQTFTVLYSFTNGSDGANPYCGLVLSDNTLYGAAYNGGTHSSGTIFAVNTDGTGFTNLYEFTGGTNGANPGGGLLLSGNTLYGTTVQHSTVFAVNTDGTGFTNLYKFPNPASMPYPILILSGNTLYGTTEGQPHLFASTVFAVNTDGTGLTNLYTFTNSSNGMMPSAGVILSGNTLYGTAALGGSLGLGTVFAVNTDGTGFTNLYNFSGSDGDGPTGNLLLLGNTLYGTASAGGSFRRGTVFAVNTDGTGFTNLHSFTALISGTNSDGASPWAGMISSGYTLYSTTSKGGSFGYGTVFAVNTDGTGFTTLYNFTGASDGAAPNDELVLSGNALYGTARNGGTGYGTVFSLSFPPQLTIIPSGADVILTWPTNYAGFNYAGFTLQSTTNLVAPAVWTTVSAGPVVVNGQNAVTNPFSGTQRFFRLSQ